MFSRDAAHVLFQEKLSISIAVTTQHVSRKYLTPIVAPKEGTGRLGDESEACLLLHRQNISEKNPVSLIRKKYLSSLKTKKQE